MSMLERFGEESIPDIIVAVLSGDLRLLADLIMSDGNPDATDGSGKTALHHAADGGDVEAARLLLGLGADPNRRDRAGRTPLHYAVLSARDELSDLLVTCGARLDAMDAHGFTPDILLDADSVAAELAYLFQTR